MNRREFIRLGTLSIPVIGSIGIDVYPQDSFSYDKFWEDVSKKVSDFSIRRFGLDISEHPALRKSSQFTYSRELFHIQVAQFWGCEPSKLSNMPYQDRVDIYALYVSQKQMEAIENYQEMMIQRHKRFSDDTEIRKNSIELADEILSDKFPNEKKTIYLAQKLRVLLG